MESLRNHLAVVRIEHPLLTDGMPDAQDRTAEHLPTQSSGMNYRADIGRSEEVDDVVLAGLNVDFNFGEAGDVRKCRAIAWIVVLGRRHQALTRQRCDRRLRQFVEIGGSFMAIVDASKLNRIF